MRMDAIAPERPARRGIRNPWAVLVILTVIYTVGFIDRQILNLLVQPIKADFGLSDTQISLLIGPAFSVAYILFSPLFGRWCDTAPRRNILLGALVVWSGFTALCGFARGFWSLFFARSGVGGAEAGMTPAVWSMLSDMFDARQLPTAFSIFLMAPYLGGGLALLFGGLTIQWVAGSGYEGWPLLAGLAPWQVTFLLVAAPGFVCALVLLAVQEPARREDPAAASAGAMPIAEVVATMRRRRGFYGFFYLGMACNFIPLYAFPAWFPAFAMRRFDMTITEVGVQYGAVTLLSGTIGVLSGPWLARMLQARGYADAYLRLPVITSLVLVAACAGMWMSTSFEVAMLCAGIAGVCYSAPASVAASALQLATPNRMRGMTSAIYVFVATVAGMLLAPTLVALLTDYVFADEARVGESLAIVCAGSAMLTAIVVARALAPYRRIIAGDAA
ncbi:MFS family permease [Sphingomonas jejuensis]|uniref:MFS family permease n=1 Tax=Sphingomonas jejuensis TaxID=904715 RepID=A0ABX0XJ35_9SPHN|nr:MFS transporter [Sphingomonas jejuensis]NJC32887.1 MFS family permease [Sphingomonas jejuensis]